MTTSKNAHVKHTLTLARYIALSSAVVVLVAGCKKPVETAVSFAPAEGIYADTQAVSVILPPLAKNVYLTTNTLAPQPNSHCQYNGETLTVDRPTVVKVNYEVEGQAYSVEAIYVVEQNYTDSQYTNRDVVFTWEKFFLDNVVRQFSPSTEEDSKLRLQDGKGGSVWLQTTIIERSVLFDMPERGSQHYAFDFFEKTDENIGKTVMLKSGAVYGYLGDGSGYYSTKRNGGSRIHYSGTYSGWAEGDFTLNGNAQAVAGEYQVYCQDLGCAADPVYYALNSKHQLVEVSAARQENTWSCEAEG